MNPFIPWIPRGFVLGLSAALTLSACGDRSAPEGSPIPGAAPSAPASPLGDDARFVAAENPTGALEWHWNQSNAQGFWCAWRAVDGPLEMGPSFPIELRLTQAPDGEPLDLPASALQVEARMPDHDHGMLQRVEIERIAPGHYRVVGMRLHMFGYWELSVDVTQPPFTERAQFQIEL